MPDLPWLKPLLARASGWLSEASNLADLAQGSTVNLAVTGLSRSGKTVFITSLIHNLLSAVHTPDRMPLLGVVGDGRLRGARVEPAGASRLPRFRYEENVEAMAAGAAVWPDRTDDLREIGIEIRFVPANAPGKLLTEISGAPAHITIRIVDYPGEWLLDLPLLTQSYEDWSRTSLALYRKGIRAEAASDFLAFIAEHRLDDPASDEIAKQANDLFRAFLTRARDAYCLSFLQPGRFLCPGTLADAPFLWFAPLDVPDNARIAPHTLGALMEERYEVYKREVVERFYQDHFRWLSRQIVLVDVLHALLAGREAFEDQQLALQAILKSFRYGSGYLLSKLLKGPHIDKVMFAATKADHVPDIQRDHLAELLRNMTAVPAIETGNASARFDFTALASVICTVDGTEEFDGQEVQVVVGKPMGSNERHNYFVGIVPIRPPRPEHWSKRFIDVPVFQPPPIDPSPVAGIAHINLDRALQFLIGDWLR
jgi:predicted YcjX-like family ATPase